jgi:hypothetical protein
VQVALDVAPTVAEAVPASHSVQAFLLVAPVADEYVPAGHFVQLVTAPPSEYVPAPQVLQTPLSRY